MQSQGQSSGIAGFMENGKAGGCCYLDDRLRCSVYENRPLYCRTYPLIRDTYDELEMSVDRSCPGVGEGEVIETGQIEQAFLLEAEHRPGSLDARESFANYEVICGSLKARGVYADANLMRSLCTDLIERGLSFKKGREMSVFLDGAAAALAMQLSDTGNLLSPEAGAKVMRELEKRLGEKPSGQAKGMSAAFCEQEQPLRICLDDGPVPGHELLYEQGRFFVGDAKGGLDEIGPMALEHSTLTSGAVDALSEYLAEWISRQSLLRYVHAAALAASRRGNVLRSFFEFLARAANRVLITAEVVRRYGGEAEVTARVMREAIRTNEGPLRRQCASAVSRY
jgi:hypothetical protein